MISLRPIYSTLSIPDPPRPRYFTHEVRLTDSCKFRPYMQDHNGNHRQSGDMYTVGRTLENDGVGDFNVSRIAIRKNPSGTLNGRWRTNKRA